MSEGRFKLRKWMMNDVEVRKKIQTDSAFNKAQRPVGGRR